MGDDERTSEQRARQPAGLDRSPRFSRRTLGVIGSLAAIALVLGLGGLIVLRGLETPFGFDTEWMDEILERRGPVLELPSLLFDFIGGGWFGVFAVPITLITVLLVLRRPWAAGFFLLSSASSALLVQLLKSLFDRPRPEDILVAADIGAFPSGHTANAATIATALFLILLRRRVAVLGAIYAVAMAVTRTYLGAHWISDTVGGFLLGVGVAVLVWAVLEPKLRAERDRHRAREPRGGGIVSA